MKRDILFSIAFHSTLVAAAFFTPSFNFQKKQNFDEIIRVNLTSMSSPTPAQPTAVAAPKTEEPKVEAKPPEEKTPVKTEPVKKPKTPVKKPQKKVEPKKEPPKKTEAEKEEKETEEPSDKSEESKTDVESAQGSPFAGATVDNANFNYPYWFTQTFNKIANNMRNTTNVDNRIFCTIYFQVLKSGRVIELRIEKSSGYPDFDEACLAAVERSAPFPPLPNDFIDEIIGITLPFTNNQ